LRSAVESLLSKGMEAITRHFVNTYVGGSSARTKEMHAVKRWSVGINRINEAAKLRFIRSDQRAEFMPTDEAKSSCLLTNTA